MARFAQGVFKPTNPAKYVGKGFPRYRSSWELQVMMFLDGNPNILQWASEAIAVKYRHPFTGKVTNYIPDFFIVYRDKNSQIHAEIVEVKPSTQSSLTEAKSKKDQAQVIINTAKWKSAQQWCKSQGLVFRVITEHQIFRNGRK